jgi:nucleoside-diphosphate-sugar epimerase
MSLARQAISDKVRRFVFVSSIGVNGNKNTRPFLESDIPKMSMLFQNMKQKENC